MDPNNFLAAWLVFTGLILTGIVTFTYRMIRDRDRGGYSTILRLLISSMLLLVMAISALPSPVPMWVYMIRVFCVQFSLLLVYITVDQSFNNKHYQSLLRSRHFLVISGLALVGLVLVYFRMRGLVQPQSYQADRAWVYYSSYLLNYSIYLYLLTRIILLYWRGLRPYRDLAYRVRLFVCMIGFSASAFSMFLLAMYDLLRPSVSSLPKSLIHLGFVWSIITSIVLLAMSFIIPHALITRIVQPFEGVLIRRQQRRHAAIWYLHQVMTRIVPGVQLHDQRLRDVRMLIEISDARQIIWSLQPHDIPITAEDEAAYLTRLLIKKEIIHSPGQYHPPPTKQPDIVKHNLAVARLLERKLIGAGIALRPDHVGAGIVLRSDRAG